MSEGLPPRQAAFVREYLADLNATQAAIRAGYSPDSAASQASELLRNPNIKAALDKAMGKRARRVEVTAERVLAEIARIAFSDPKDMLEAGGDVRDIHKMPKHARRAIAGLEVVVGDDGSTRTKKIKTWDKVKALELLCKHLGLTRERLEHSGGEGLSVTIDIGAKKEST